ncbi:hypothetical protein OKW40_005018 [Paraburkholderia sp. RAU6.4a]
MSLAKAACTAEFRLTNRAAAPAMREVDGEVKKGTGNCLPFVKTGAPGQGNSSA